MLPLILTVKLPIGLAGQGDALERRRALLTDAGVSPVTVTPGADENVLAGLRLLFVAGLEAPEALAARARAAGVLVNVEDVPALCDFHIPALVRQGDLLLTISTGGKAPGLSRLIRRWLEQRFGPEWRGRIGEAEDIRRAARAAGLGMAGVSEVLQSHVEEKGWLS